MNDINLFHVFRKKSGVFYRSVSSAVYRYNLSPIKHAVTGRAIGNTLPYKLLFLFYAEVPIFCSGCQNYRFRFILFVLRDYNFVPILLLNGENLFKTNLRSQFLCLVIQVGRKLKTGNLLDSGIILYLRCIDNLSTVSRTFQYKNGLAGANAVNCRGKAGGPCPYYNQIEHIFPLS